MRTTKRLVALMAVCVALATAADVLVTPKGKSYHTHKCMALSRSKEIKTITEAAAKAEGRKLCGICNRSKKGGAK